MVAEDDSDPNDEMNPPAEEIHGENSEKSRVVG